MKSSFDRFTDKFGSWVFAAALIFVGITLIISTGKSCDTNMQFIMLGVDNETQINLSLSNQRILEVRYACTKICTDELYHDSFKLKSCWEQCNNLGG